jgi:topoisomerase IV subunit B
VEIRWKCAADLITDETPPEASFQFPGGLADHLRDQVGERDCATAEFFSGNQDFADEAGRVEWAVAWPLWSEGSYSYYCNTIPTPDGGTHEAGLRTAIVKGIRAFGALVGQKKAEGIAAEDIVIGSEIMLSVFIREPQFQSQTKDRLTSPEAAKLVERAVQDHFDHYLADNMERGKALLAFVMDRMDERLRRRAEKEIKRKTATSARKLRLPGKLTDCANAGPEGTEIFIVEGDSAGGSAKQARDRKTQAILPIRGKILNVASATQDKIRGNQEIADLGQALGCGTRKDCNADLLRYERVVIMTDADVDGAHIATLLMTFFFQEMPEIVRAGHLYLAQPPLYRLTVGAKSIYARDDAHRAEIEANEFKGKKVEVGRFKGLGEMNPNQLKETTMDPKTRSMLRVTLPKEYEERAGVRDLVDRLMGKNPEHRFNFIQENAARVDEESIDA